VRLHWGAGAVAIALVGAVACSSGSGDDDDGASAAATKPEAKPEWTSLGRDLDNDRAAAAEHTVGPDNVDQLAPAWQLDAKGVTGTPLVVDGIVYVGDWTGHVRALDADTGKEKWSAPAGSYYIGGSVALDDDRVFAGTFNAHVVALDRATGKQLWDTAVGDHSQAVIFGSPIQIDGLVVVGVASYELMTGNAAPTFRGHVVALDAKTGKERWRWWATSADAKSGPGVAIWSSPAIDTERGVVYIGTGNTYTPPPAPKADGIAALDLATGKEKWVTQFTVGDTWTTTEPAGSDSDVGAPPNLFTVDGKDVVGAADKAGSYHALDRDTGKTVWKTKLTKGGLQGGVLASAAVADGSVFVASNRGSINADLLSLDADTGHVAWRVDLKAHVSGPVSWANGVVYVSDDSGRIAGYDATDGHRLWSYKVATSAAGGISVVDGTVYAGWGWWFASPPPDAKGGLIAFRLGGKAAAGASSGGSSAVSGEDVYQANCARCHGGTGHGGSGPSMVGVAGRLSKAEHLKVVRNGRAGMPAWKDDLSDEEIEAVVEYERTVLSEG
jgi:polyvinyl alcohol dehydrogenase (cytochrome)